jgi:Spx/MgsR family transcriptional regulator
MAPVVYGIPNCDQVKRALAWFASHEIPVEFHDFRKSGAPGALLRDWTHRCNWETLLNRRGTTWRKLPDANKAQVVDAPSAIRLMTDQPSVIRRPVVDYNGCLLVGFDPALFAKTFLGWRSALRG